MDCVAGFTALKRNGGRATVRELAAWCDAPKDPTDTEAEGFARAGLVQMVGQLDVLGARQVSAGTLDAVIAITAQPKMAFEFP